MAGSSSRSGGLPTTQVPGRGTCRYPVKHASYDGTILSNACRSLVRVKVATLRYTMLIMLMVLLSDRYRGQSCLLLWLNHS